MGSEWGPIVGSGSGSGPGGGGDEDYWTDNFTLNSSDVSNQYVVLTHVPQYANQVSLTIINGPDQEYGVDYTITADDGGKRLSWATLGLDSLVEVGDKVVVKYPIIS